VAADPDRARDLRLQRIYGITSDQYEAMLAYQGGVCWICGNPPKKTRLHVDHDHKSGLVRGLLCWSCNRRVLPAARDNACVLTRAAEYLEEPPAQQVIGHVTVPPKPKRKRKRRTTKETSNS
jgi:hypothetical protein